jgi:HemY protein
MRLALWVLVGLLLGALGAHFLLPDNGYVLVSFHSYVIEMSVPALVILLVLGYASVRILVGLWRSPAWLGGVLAERRQRGVLRQLTSALVHMVEGDWQKGERLLTRGLKGGEAPLINYLMAARAAQLQGSRERRDEWLQIAQQEQPQAEAAVLLTQAELEIDAGEYERALAPLRRLQQIHPDHPMGLALQARAYHGLKDWAAFVDLLPRLGGARLEAPVTVALAAEALEHYLERNASTAAQLADLWAGVPSKLRPASELVRVHALALDRLGEGDLAERELRAAIRRQWNEGLVHAYGQVKGADLVRQLKRAESWLEAHPEDGPLLLTTARLCIRNQLWGKARSYLESSLAISPVPEAYALYGRLLSELGEDDGAARAYRSGLGLVAHSEDLPALTAPQPRRRAGKDLTRSAS